MLDQRRETHIGLVHLSAEGYLGTCDTVVTPVGNYVSFVSPAHLALAEICHLLAEIQHCNIMVLNLWPMSTSGRLQSSSLQQHSSEQPPPYPPLAHTIGCKSKWAASERCQPLIHAERLLYWLPVRVQTRGSHIWMCGREKRCVASMCFC